MDINYLHSFVELTKTLNFTEAAAKLYMSQPALTKQIKAIERSLGIKLLERNTRHVQLTEIGKDFSVFAKNIVDEYDASLQCISNYIKNAENRIVLGANTFFSYMGLGNLLSSYHSIFPNVYIRTQESSSSTGELISRLLCEEFDAVITSYSSQHSYPENIIAFPIITDEIVLIVNKDHPFFKLGKIDISQLEEVPFIMPSKVFLWHNIIKKIFQEEGVTLKDICEISMNETIVTLVSDGTGVAMFSYQVAKALQKMFPDIGIVRFKKAYYKNTAIIVRKDYKKRSALNEFVKFVISWSSEQFSELVE